MYTSITDEMNNSFIYVFRCTQDVQDAVDYTTKAIMSGHHVFAVGGIWYAFTEMHPDVFVVNGTTILWPRCNVNTFLLWRRAK